MPCIKAHMLIPFCIFFATFLATLSYACIDTLSDGLSLPGPFAPARFREKVALAAFVRIVIDVATFQYGDCFQCAIAYHLAMSMVLRVVPRCLENTFVVAEAVVHMLFVRYRG